MLAVLRKQRPVLEAEVIPPMCAGRDDTDTAEPAVTVVLQPRPSTPKPLVPPGYTPGLCWHPAHVALDGIRYGVTPILSAGPETSRAALTRCHHHNSAGE